MTYVLYPHTRDTLWFKHAAEKMGDLRNTTLVLALWTNKIFRVQVLMWITNSTTTIPIAAYFTTSHWAISRIEHLCGFGLGCTRFCGGRCQRIGKGSTNGNSRSNNGVSFHSFLEDNSRYNDNDNSFGCVQDTWRHSANMTERRKFTRSTINEKNRSIKTLRVPEYTNRKRTW